MNISNVGAHKQTEDEEITAYLLYIVSIKYQVSQTNQTRENKQKPH